MTPVYARIIATCEELAYRAPLRRYLQSHISGEIQFQAIQTAHADGADTVWPRHVNAQYAFDFELHLSYVAIRNTPARPDPRGIREHAYMVEPYDAPLGSHQDIVCYDAQISFIVVGKDTDNWKAYCNVDTWFDSEPSVEEYYDRGQNPASGGVRSADDPCLNPMECFLLVLCHRLRHTGMEWGTVLTILMERVDAYVSQPPQVESQL